MKLARVFGNGCVLQRQKPIVVFGEGADGESVRVSLGADNRISFAETVCENGRWMVKLPEREVSTGLTMIVESDKERIELKDIAVGEVWLGGGQSNMEFLMKYDADRETALSGGTQDLVRFYEVPKVSYEGMIDDEDHSDEGIWRKADPENIGMFSAVGFYFAMKIREKLGDIPVGMIGCNWGGSSAACWLGEEYLTGELQEFADLVHRADGIDLEKELERFKKDRANQRTPEARARMDAFMSHALTEPMHFQLSQEMHEAFMRTKYAPFSPFRPNGLYHTMLETVIPYSLRGFLWYQGEEDSFMPAHYTELMEAMIRCWRDRWGAELPFILAQLPVFKNPGGFNSLDYVPIRRCQEETAKTVPNTYMACILDKGLPYEIHPKEKKPVGERMALLALSHVYGEEVLCEVPDVIGAVTKDGVAEIVLKDTKAGLERREDSLDAFKVTVMRKEITDFEVTVEGNRIKIGSEKIKPGSRIRIEYGQKDYFTVSLFDSEGIPVRPFAIEL